MNFLVDENYCSFAIYNNKQYITEIVKTNFRNGESNTYPLWKNRRLISWNISQSIVTMVDEDLNVYKRRYEDLTKDYQDNPLCSLKHIESFTQ